MESRLEFTFQQCLGMGGFGEVYLATIRRTGLDKRAAVKVLRPGLDHELQAVRRLIDEGRMLAMLDHPNILRADELTRVAGRLALVMEYVDGIDLSQCAEPGRLLPHKVVLEALAQVAGALHSAWTQISPETGNPLQLVHRDIKPDNIRVSAHGQVKLLDFGIARTTEMTRKAKTRVGDMAFTPGYAAPEAFTHGTQGPAADVYALGVSLFRLLTGARLYGDLELPRIVALATQAERYHPYIDQQMSTVRARPAVVDLLRRMLSFRASRRPTAAETEALLQELARAEKGPGLVRWARATRFPKPRDLPGASLTGQTVCEDEPDGSPTDVSISVRFQREQVKRARAEPLHGRREAARTWVADESQEQRLSQADASTHVRGIGEAHTVARDPALHEVSTGRTVLRDEVGQLERAGRQRSVSSSGALERARLNEPLRRTEPAQRAIRDMKPEPDESGHGWLVAVGLVLAVGVFLGGGLLTALALAASGLL